jgi:hypothetical protein
MLAVDELEAGVHEYVGRKKKKPDSAGARLF